ncbi:unnamed protein product, partial [Polarella glacialis]
VPRHTYSEAAQKEAVGPQPGIYRCVHGPRVAIRAAPSSSAAILDTIHPGDVLRVSEIIAPGWARIDVDEVWARWTSPWPRLPRGVISETGDDEPENDLDEEQAADLVPQHAFILIDGTEVGIDGLLIQRLSDAESQQVRWPFRDALEARCAEANAVHLRKSPSAASGLRQRFVDRALSYVGTPCHRMYHDPNSEKCKPGSDLYNAPRFLDSMQLIQQ